VSQQAAGYNTQFVIIRKAMAELQLRISKGYENINLALINIIAEDNLKVLRIK